MDQGKNPYTPGAGLRPPLLSGRDALLAEIEIVIARTERQRLDSPIVLIGLRGVGKTVLLQEAYRRVREASWIFVLAEGGNDTAQFVARLASDLDRSVKAAEIREPDRFRDKLKRARATIGRFRVSAKLDPASGAPSLDLEVDRTVPAGGGTEDLEVNLTSLLEDLGQEAADAGIGIAVLVDELQDLPEDVLAALITAVHRAQQMGLPVALIGAGLPTLPKVLSEAKSYAERYRYRTVDQLDQEASAAAIEGPAESEGVTWDEGAVRRIVAASGGYPYFIQQLASSTWALAARDSIITAADADAGIARGLAELDSGFFDARWQRATPVEQEVMQRMAEVSGQGPVQIATLAEAMGRATSGISVARDGLLKKGLVFAPERGVLAFTTPGMADHIARRRTPVADRPSGTEATPSP